VSVWCRVRIGGVASPSAVCGPLVAALLMCVSVSAAQASDDPHPTARAGGPEPVDTSLAASLAAVESVFDKDGAWKLLKAIDPFYRVRGNQGYLRSLERALLMMKDGGFSDPSAPGGNGDTARFRDFGPVMPAWTPFSGSLSVISPDVGQLHAFENEASLERTFVCANSFPTKPEGVVAPLVRFEHSKPPESYAGTIVYGTLSSESLFEQAVVQGGALGVISSFLPDYNDPSTNTDAIRFSKIPYDAQRKGFGLNVSPAKARVLERLLGGGMVYVRVAIRARFTEARSRTLVGRIRGSDPHAGTVALVAHLDEPGTNDNGSGVAATVGIATGYLQAIHDGRLPRPRRNIVFLIGTEFECSREWLRANSDKVDLAIVIDMVGEDPAENGAFPLVERMPDPGAIWDRAPLDIHSEWGRSDVRQGELVGNFLNDYVMAAMRERQKGIEWPVRTNPYEGGSDHESFLERGIPAVLLWHFTDPYYHTNLDRLDKVSLDEMENVAVATLALVNHYASAGQQRAQEVLDIVMDAARVRLKTESKTARTRLAVQAVREDPVQLALVTDRERTIIVAWSHWYREAVLSIEHFEPGIQSSAPRRTLEANIDKALTELRGLERQALSVIDAQDG
jgi:aminopeptidase YwaD